MNALSVARLDLQRLLVRPFAWTLAAIALGALAWMFLQNLNAFLLAQPGLQICLLLAPLTTMHAIAGERRGHTLPLLFASGLSPARIVLGKFFSALVYLLALLVLVALMPVLLAHATTPDWGQFGAALLGCALCIGALTAIGIAASAFASHPAVAALASLLIVLILAMLDIGGRITGMGAGWIAWLALPTHLTPFMHGLVASVDIIYFLLLIALALSFAIRRMAAEKVRG